MTNIDASLFNFAAFDRLSRQDGLPQRLDPRTKVVTVLAFIVCVLSFNRYQITALIPFLLFPAYFIFAGRVPLAFVGRKLMLAAPFILLAGLFNPLFDKTPLHIAGGYVVTGGWVSLGAIIFRFLLTVGAAVCLMATTEFAALCAGLVRLGLPQAFVLQLSFLYRYLFVLVDEGARMSRARALRSFKGRGLGLKVYGNIIGQLFLRSLDRSRRVHKAMLCRGFTGELRTARRLEMSAGDWTFMASWLVFFVAARFVDLPALVAAGLQRAIS